MQAKTVKEVLTAMEWMLTNVGWTQGAAYRDKRGSKIIGIDPDLSKVRSMCLLGAAGAVEAPITLYRETLTALGREIFHGNISSFNDEPDQTLQGVLKVIRQAKRNA